MLKADKEALEDELNGAYEKIQELEDHISVISQALEVKATEIGNVNPLTLLTLGENKELMNKIKDKERISQVQMEELRISLDNAMDQVDELKDSNEKLLTQNLDMEKRMKKLEQDKKNIEEVIVI